MIGKINGKRFDASKFAECGSFRFYVGDDINGLNLLAAVGYEVHPIEELPRSYVDSDQPAYIFSSSLVRCYSTARETAEFEGWELDEYTSVMLETMRMETRS